MTGAEVEGRLASLGDECRLRCGGEEGQAIAYWQAGVEVELAKKRQRVLVDFNRTETVSTERRVVWSRA